MTYTGVPTWISETTRLGTVLVPVVAAAGTVAVGARRSAAVGARLAVGSGVAVAVGMGLGVGVEATGEVAVDPQAKITATIKRAAQDIQFGQQDIFEFYHGLSRRRLHPEAMVQEMAHLLHGRRPR